MLAKKRPACDGWPLSVMTYIFIPTGKSWQKLADLLIDLNMSDRDDIF